MGDVGSGAAAAPLVGGPAVTPQKHAGGSKNRGRGGVHGDWFALFAPATLMPMLEQAAHDLQRRGYGAAARLTEASGRLIAELEVVPPTLPMGARPPRLAIAASRPPRQQNPSQDRPLLVEFTGTFPRAGAMGGFGGEIDYATIYPAQLQEKLAEFIDMATA